MKKLTSILLSLFIILSLSACGNQSNPPAENKTNPDASSNKDNTNNNTANNQNNTNNNAGTGTTGTAANYKDGTYDAMGDKWEHGQESAVVTIEKGKITKVDLKRLDTAGKEVNYDEWTGEKDATGKVRPNLKQFRLDMAKKIIDKQSTQIDDIAGATVSAKNWKVAAQRALDKAKGQ